MCSPGAAPWSPSMAAAGAGAAQKAQESASSCNHDATRMPGPRPRRLTLAVLLASHPLGEPGSRLRSMTATWTMAAALEGSERHAAEPPTPPRECLLERCGTTKKWLTLSPPGLEMRC